MNGQSLVVRHLLVVLVHFSLATLNVAAVEKPTRSDRSPAPTDRIPWTSSQLKGTPDPPMPFRVERVFAKLPLNSPITLRDLPGRNRRLVLEKGGRILTFPSVDDPQSLDVALDLAAHIKTTEGEKVAAARDLILDPNFEQNGFLYVIWAIAFHEIEDGAHVSRFTLDQQNPPRIDPATRLDILTYPSGDHIGTSLRFGPDGMFYITTGDGSPPFPPDTFKTAQNISDVRGAVLRIDVREATEEEPYRIPTDNPFVDWPEARKEIFAIGIRNGFRSAFDPQTGDFWVADVGWERAEMIHRIEKGGNHGWSLKEGPYDVDLQQTAGPGLRADGSPIPPAIVMARDEAQSVTGGIFVPEDCHLGPALSTKSNYIFGCYVNGGVWSADVTNPEKPIVKKIARTGLRIIDFMTTRLDSTPPNQAEILVVDFGGGLYRLAFNENQAAANRFPRKLSETGLFADCSALLPSPGVIEYQPAASMHRDGATARRFLGIPGTGKILPHPWLPATKYPTWTVFANTLSREVVDDSGKIDTRKMETQVLLYDGLTWNPYTYRWNDAQTDATLVGASGESTTLIVPDPLLGGGEEPSHQSIQYAFSSRTQCSICHGVALPPIKNSFRPEQLNANNRAVRRSLEAGDSHHVFQDWNELVNAGYVAKFDVPEENWLVDPRDETFSLEDRARSYLSVQCSGCHQKNGGATSAVNVRKSVAINEMGIVDVAPSQGDFGMSGGKLLAPGHPEHSILIYRLVTNGPGKMPKIGAGQPDHYGAKLVWDWIASLEPVSGQANPPNDLSKALLAWRENLEKAKPDAQATAHQYLATGDAVVGGLFEPWIDPEQRTSRIGTSPNVSELLALKGDAARGKVWFADAASAQCRTCHQLQVADGTTENFAANAIGPSLAGIGSRRTTADILDQILYPSKSIDKKWQSYFVLTADGEIITGLKAFENDELIKIRSSDGHLHEIATDEIDSIKPQDQSLMPAGLCESMSPQELADLIAYLASLK